MQERRSRIIYHRKTAAVGMNRSREKLRTELKQYQKRGICLLLNGRESTPKAIEKACRIAEENSYMRDYIQDEQGKIQGLSFDFIGETGFQLYTK